MASTRLADQIGRVLGDRYRLAAAIGTGASAHVFLADDVRLARRVAVKVLHPALADDAAFLRRFRAEARAAAALSHPNILAVYDWGEEEDGPYIVTEFLGGGSLRAMLDRGHRLSQSQALLVGLEAARGLDYAHRRGLVHRDIKPANLLFDDEGRLRIADFGLARALAEAAWTEPSGSVLGTARYAAPEQVRGVPLDGKADVYALAVVLVEAVSGRLPFAADTTVGTILSRLEKPLDVPPEMGPLGPVLARAGQPDPSARPDAMALGSALHALAATLLSPEPLPLAGLSIFDEAGVVLDPDPTDMGVGADPTVVTERPPVGGPPATVATATAKAGKVSKREKAEKPPKPARRKRRWLRVTLAAVLVLACGVVGTVAFVQAQVPTHTLPILADMKLADAKKALDPLRFTMIVKQEYSDTKAVDTVLHTAPPPGRKLKEGKVVTVWVSNGSTPADPPDLSKLNGDDAKAAIAGVGLKVAVTTAFSETVDAGQVVDWQPRKGTRHGDTVNLTVSVGPEPRTIPDVTGLTYDQAAQAITDKGLTPARDDRYDDTVPTGKLIGTRPAVGQKAQKGDTVTIVVSKGQPSVPNMLGMTEVQAKAALEAVDLKLGTAYGPSGGRVILARPDSGSKLKRFATVDVYVA